MLRILFEKLDNGIWISHLDLMRVFQRAFRRAGLRVKHTQGFNPHAFVSIALPLPVGTASRCELLEFELADGCEVSLDELPAGLDAVLPAGIRCREAYQGGRKLRDLAWLRTETVLEYDRGIPEGLLSALTELFAREVLMVEKRSKRGPVEVDIEPWLHSLEARALDGQTAVLGAVVRAQDPPLDPALLVKAIGRYLPELAPDFAKSERIELYTAGMEIFR